MGKRSGVSDERCEGGYVATRERDLDSDEGLLGQFLLLEELCQLHLFVEIL